MDKTSIRNWGNYPLVESEVFSTPFQSEIASLVQNSDTLLARGNGRCYGDAALNSRIYDTHKLNKFLGFDPETGILTCEAGVLLSDILELAVPQGYFLPVTPGTKFITVGGAIAADVHGKNHHAEGTFSDHLLAFDLMDETGTVVTCTPDQHADLFWKTAGGMGLTGIILRATFRLKPIETAFIRQEKIKAANLSEIMDLFEESASWTYTVAWIDCLQKGKNLGRSIMMRGEHALVNELTPAQKEKALALPKKLNLNVPFNFPSFTLNALTVKAFNFLFYNKQFARVQKDIIDYDSFFYPLDAIHNWNRIYGNKGFTQYQFVLPKEAGREGLEKILQTIAQSGQGSFLAVLKLFGEQNPLAIHSFPMEGYTLALDFKINKSLLDLIPKLDELVAQYGGRIYLAKDTFSKKHGLPASLVQSHPHKFDSIQQARLRHNLVSHTQPSSVL